MADVYITGIDERVMSRLRRRAEQHNRSVESLIREELERVVSVESLGDPNDEEPFLRQVQRLRKTAASERYPDVSPVEIEGIPASELLIRDRRRR